MSSTVKLMKPCFFSTENDSCDAFIHFSAFLPFWTFYSFLLLNCCRGTERSINFIKGRTCKETISGLSRDSFMWFILPHCFGFNFSKMWGFRWGPSSSYRNAKFASRLSSDMVKASLAWMMPMFHCTCNLRGTVGVVCVSRKTEGMQDYCRIFCSKNTDEQQVP